MPVHFNNKLGLYVVRYGTYDVDKQSRLRRLQHILDSLTNKVFEFLWG